MNTLHYGDAVQVCENTSERFDLVYLDPPYATGLAFETRDGRKAYEDTYTPDELVDMLKPRLEAIRERMSDSGTLYLHLDYRAAHYAKIACDRIFGINRFLAEIVWSPGNGVKGPGKSLRTTHQTILVFGKGRDVIFNADDPILREPFAEKSLKTHFRNIDADGRHYRESTANGKTYRYYADEGRRLGSVWTDVPAMAANSPVCSESTGYPTQKPERLLERIIKASSAPGAVVADLMCGSGTTLVVAAKLGRRFVGSDKSLVAIDTTAKRLAAEGIGFEFRHFGPRA